MRLAIAGFAAIVCVAVACRDDNQLNSANLTSPPKPVLTVKTLPKDASTICVANVRQRDQLLAKPQTAVTSRRITALGAVIDDVCK